MTTIEINLELAMVIVLLIVTLVIGYFVCYYPCARTYGWGRKRVENFSCPHCNSTDIGRRGDHYYCYQCKIKLKRKVK